jgi:hypothetical protein
MRDRRSIFRDFLIRRKRRWTWVVVGFKTALHIFWNAAGKTVGSNRRRQPGVGMNTDPTISTCPLTSTSSTSRESVRHAPCPDSPSHS